MASSKIKIKSLLILIAVFSSGIKAQNCKIDMTPVSPEILSRNKIKEVRVFKIGINGDKIKFQNYFIDENGGCNKEYFYVDGTKNNDPIISECIFDLKEMCSKFSKYLIVNGTKTNILNDEECYSNNGKLLKKITIEGDEIVQKTIHLFDPINSYNEEKRFYKISVKENDTLTKVTNIKTEKRHLYYLINKTGKGVDTERSETIFETPTSGSIKVYRNEKLITEYDFGKDDKTKKKDERLYESYGLPNSENPFQKTFTNNDKSLTPINDTLNCKYFAMVKTFHDGTITALVYDNKTKLLLKETNIYKGKNIEGREYEYVK